MDVFGATSRAPPVTLAEDCDAESFFDDTSENQGGAYRLDSEMDIKAAGEGYAVGWMVAGEWLEYTIYVPEEGDFPITVRSGSVGTRRTLALSQCDEPLIKSFKVPSVNEWGQFKTWSVGTVHLSPGWQKIRVSVRDSDFLDLDWIHIGLDEKMPQMAMKKWT